MTKPIWSYLYFAVAILISGNSICQNNVIITSPDSVKFVVYMNGVRQNYRPNYDLKVINLKSEKCEIKLKISGSNSNVEKNLFFENDNQETSLELVGGPEKYKLMYLGEVAMGQAAVSIEQFTTSYRKSDAEAGDTINENPLLTQSLEATEIAENGVLDGTFEEPMPLDSSTLDSVTLDSLRSLPKVYVSNYNGEFGCSKPESSIKNTQQAIAEEVFSDRRLKKAKKLITGGCFTSAQIEEISQAFEYEDNKVAFLIYSYDFVYDIDNYSKLRRTLQFKPTLRKFDQFVLSR